jgi:hypothetical protein
LGIGKKTKNYCVVRKQEEGGVHPSYTLFSNHPCTNHGVEGMLEL